MNINVMKNDRIKKITIMGELETEKEKKYFFSLTDDENVFELNITFLNAKILPGDVIERLAWLQKQNKSRLHVLQRYLYSYLYNIGIKCIYIDRIMYQSQSGFNSGTPIATADGPSQEQIISFLQEIYDRYGYDYSQYQIDSLRRRIKIAMVRQNINDLKIFRDAVLQDEDVFEQLFLEFSINTTGFFRDPEVFAIIKNKIIPYLNSYSHIKVWCAGCSTGKEAYSLAIMLYELGILEKTQIYATDLNPYIIEEAKNGLFSTDTLESDIRNYRMTGGEKNFIDYFELRDNYIKIKDEFKKNILFFQHSLVSNGILNEFQLILCRNVLIYFNADLQEKVIELFYNSLDISGFLVLGKSEGILQNRGERYFSEYHKTSKIYRKKCFDTETGCIKTINPH